MAKRKAKQKQVDYGLFLGDDTRVSSPDGFPTYVVIAGQVWPLIVCRDVTSKNNVLGQINYNNVHRGIYLRADLSKEVLWETMMHEVYHGYVWEYGRRRHPTDLEEQCDFFAKCFMDFTVNNPHVSRDVFLQNR